MDGELLLGWLLMLVIYLTPTIVVFLRKKKDVTKIILVNIFLGWTVVGWILAVIWAFGMDDEKPVRTTPAGGEKHKTGTTHGAGAKSDGTIKKAKGTKSKKGSKKNGAKKSDEGPAKSEGFIKDGELVKGGEIKKSTGLKGSMTKRKSTWRCLKCETINEDNICGVCRSEKG